MRMQLVLALPREMASVPVARRTVTAALKAAQVGPECLDEVEVALSEACTNVVRHAGNHHSYEVGISLGDDCLTMDIVDFGEGFGGSVPSSDMPDTTVESGRHGAHAGVHGPGGLRLGDRRWRLGPSGQEPALVLDR
jgi:serine/threonine-protein kinase RsbW